MKLTVEEFRSRREHSDYYYIYLMTNNGGYMNDAIATFLNISYKNWNGLLNEFFQSSNRNSRNLEFKNREDAERFVELLEPHAVMKELMGE